MLLPSTLLAFVTPAAAVQQEAFFTGLGDLPGGPHWSQVSAISPDGSVAVGRSAAVPPIGFSQPFEAFAWTLDGGMVGLGDLDGGTIESRAADVSAGGAVIVGSTDSGAFLWTQVGGMTPLVDTTGGFPFLIPTSLSADGLVVAGNGYPLSGGTEVFRWTMTTGVENLGSLPNDIGFPDGFAFGMSADGAVITGTSMSTSPNVEPIRWTALTGLVGLGDVPGGLFYAIGEGVSGDGSTIVGGARTEFELGSRDEAFLWRESTGFGFLDPERGAEFGSTAYACSADGTVIVGYFGAVGAMIWDEAHGMRGVRDLLEGKFGVDLGDWTLGAVYDVSANGTVLVGNGLNPEGDPEGWLAVLPSLAGGRLRRATEAPLPSPVRPRVGN